MGSKSQVSKDLRAKAKEIQEIVHSESAGEMSRITNWSYFAKGIVSNYALRELAQACVEQMSKEEKRIFIERLKLQ